MKNINKALVLFSFKLKSIGTIGTIFNRIIYYYIYIKKNQTCEAYLNKIGIIKYPRYSKKVK